MPLKHYGIYLAYPPTVDIRYQGLGRYLLAFLKSAAKRPDLRFVVVCPSWSREDLETLLAMEGIETGGFDIRSPKERPWILRVYLALRAYRNRRRGISLLRRALSRMNALKDGILEWLAQYLVSANPLIAISALLLGGAALAFTALIASPLLAAAAIVLLVVLALRWVDRRCRQPWQKMKGLLRSMLSHPESDGLVLRIYRKMEAVESKRMLSVIAELRQVRAWYSPTAFWPAFNEIDGPRLMCVPDVVLADFPIGFSAVGGQRFLSNFEAVERSIKTGQHFVTYSETVKWKVLVERYLVAPETVTVVQHAPQDLSALVTAKGGGNVAAISHHYSEWLFSQALSKSSQPQYTGNFFNRSVRFLFYASQFRPNKNLISLLRAYEYLLRKRFIGHKLILTGDPKAWRPVEAFIAEHRLEHDVLCLHGLTNQELAACYKLADLAVNPSLSEGGCPFTFTEALSVGTPVVMSRIAVTEEVLVDPQLRDMSFFDPYDWMDIAERIEWALQNRASLLEIQCRSYELLKQRSWADVVDEHVDALERVAAGHVHSPALKVRAA